MENYFISHVIFDNDGLLMDTESLYYDAIQTSFSKFFDTIIYSQEIHSTVFGTPLKSALRNLFDRFQLDKYKYEEFKRNVEEEVKSHLPNVRLQPGIFKFVHHLYKCGIPMGVATSSLTELFELKASHHSILFSLMDVIVTGSMIVKGKPDPEIFNLTSKKFSKHPLHPSHVLVLEDSPQGVIGAKNAGMTTLLIPSFPLAKEQMSHASLVLSSAHYLKPEIFGFPPYDYSPVTTVIFQLEGILLERSRNEIDSMDSVNSSFSFNMENSSSDVSLMELNQCTEEFLCSRVELKDDAEKLLNHLSSFGIKMFLLSKYSTHQHLIFFATLNEKIQSLLAYFEYVIHESPENPITYSAEIFSGSSAPNKCLVFENSVKGLERARKAGMQVVLLSSLTSSSEEMTNATQVIESLRDFNPHDFGLHAYE